MGAAYRHFVDFSAVMFDVHCLMHREPATNICLGKAPTQVLRKNSGNVNFKIRGRFGKQFFKIFLLQSFSVFFSEVNELLVLF